MRSLIGALSSLCRQFPLREKIVVVPSLAIGHQLGDAVAREGTSWINLRFETVRTLADAIAGFSLAHEGWTMLSRAQALGMIERACDRVLDDTSYFASLRTSPGLHRAIQRSIDDLRLAGIGASIPSGAFEIEQKGRDLARLLEAYEEELRNEKLVDRCGMIARAITLLENGSIGPWNHDAVWIAVDELELAQEESRLVELASRDAVKVRIAGVRDDGATLPQLARVNFVNAKGEENEVRAVLRAILREKVRFDDVELVYAARDPYLPLMFELAAEYGVDTTFAEGVAVSFTSPGQACLAFLRWCGEGWNAVDLDLAARAGAIRTDGGEDGAESLTPADFSRVLRESKIGWGRERYEPALRLLEASLQKVLADSEISDTRREISEKRLRQVRAALPLVRTLLEITATLVSEESVPGSVLARAASAFVTSFGARRNERDGMALSALRKMFDELARLPENSVPLAEGCARLRDAVHALYTSASNPRPGHLHVTPIRAAGWSGRSRMFLLGLAESKFPGAGLQDPIVLDQEREGLNARIQPRQLALPGEAPRRAAERLRRCLARRADAHWTISFPSLSLRDQRESFPASELLEIFRAARGNPSARFEDLFSESSLSTFVDGEVPLAAGEWWLAQRFLAGAASYPKQLHAAYPWLARGDEAEAARSGTALTRWDGVFEVDPAEVDPRLNGRELSASQIEKMASCPYGWFLRNLLRVEPTEDLLRDPTVWLDPRNRGSMLHELFEMTMRELCEKGERPNLEKHLSMMREIAEKVLAEWRVEVPPPNEAAFCLEQELTLETCRTFLRIEQEACVADQPMFFELPFGFPDAAAHPAGMVDLLEVDLGGGRSVRLRGRIDRVDRTPSGGWAVWDYKTGSTYGYEDAWTFDRGRRVQHAIYARALAEALRRKGIDADPKIEKSGYLFPTAKGGGRRIEKTHTESELKETLNRTFDLIASGFFAHPDEDDDCRFCDYKEVCGADTIARTEAKYEANDQSPLVEKWRRLRDVE